MLRTKNWVWVAVAGMVVGVVGWGGFNTLLEATNRMEFCVSCHEMRDNVYAEYQKSPHYLNASGVRATCPDCHVPKDWTHKLIRKVQASGELFHWAIGSVDSREKFVDKRHALAKREWQRMRDSDSRECRNCHSFEAMDFHKQSMKAARAMRDAARAGGTCIDCHKGVAHTMPDVNAGHRKRFAALRETARTTEIKPGDVVYSVEPLPFGLERAPSDPDSADGQFSAAAALHVLARDGDDLKVRLDGWFREDMTDTVFSQLGRRNTLATLAVSVQERVAKGEKAVDPDSEEEWTKVRVEAWVKDGRFLSDPAPLWDYAAHINQDACTLCHDARRSEEFTVSRWIGHINSMKRQTELTEAEAQMLLSYMQSNAKDAR